MNSGACGALSGAATSHFIYQKKKNKVKYAYVSSYIHTYMNEQLHIHARISLKRLNLLMKKVANCNACVVLVIKSTQK